MLFTTLPFALFTLMTFFLYWFVFNRNVKSQNLFLLLCSYVFYGSWDWRFLFLLVLVSVINYAISLLIQKSVKKRTRKSLFLSGVFINTGTLVVFKYFNFFSQGFIAVASLLGVHFDYQVPGIIMPLGISFYIFLCLSYLVDIYKGRITAHVSLVDALLSFSFFPIIMAGPIHRPVSLLKQIQDTRILKYRQATDGLKQILWGLFMKIVIADNCSFIVNTIFSNYFNYNSSSLILGIFLFTFQIYTDFSGYSNIAIGLGKLFGFDIMRNFAYPYFARDIKEFWKRWNISLTAWFRDYVFLPLAYYVSGKIKAEKVLMIKSEFIIYITGIIVTWLLTGLWHGANLTFIVWGLIQGFFLVLYHIGDKPRRKVMKKLKISHNNKALILCETVFTFVIIMFSFIFFKANTVGQALMYISGIFTGPVFTIPAFPAINIIIKALGIILVFLVAEWLGRNKEYAISDLPWPKFLRWAMYYGIILVIFWFSGSSEQFIYFQF